MERHNFGRVITMSPPIIHDFESFSGKTAYFKAHHYPLATSGTNRRRTTASASESEHSSSRRLERMISVSGVVTFAGPWPYGVLRSYKEATNKSSPLPRNPLPPGAQISVRTPPKKTTSISKNQARIRECRQKSWSEKGGRGFLAC